MSTTHPEKEETRNISTDDESRTTDASRVNLLIAIVWMGLVVAHATKSLGFFPMIMPDEYTYASDIRHRPFSQAVIPNYLFYAIYSITGFFGKSFLDAARVLNAIFFMFAAPFVYWTARRVSGKTAALVVALIAAVSPISSYTAYFMPESLYFTSFWIMTWLFVGRKDAPVTASDFARMGACIGVLALIKTHGVFLLPGLLLFILTQTPRDTRRGYFRQAAISFSLGLAAFAAVRMGGGFLFAGAGGLNPLGSAYSDLANTGKQAISLLSLFSKTFYSLLGHIIGLALIMGIPILVSIFQLCRPLGTEKADNDRLRCMATYALCFLIPLICITVLFSGVMDEMKPDLMVRDMSRIQWRYYTFIFPLFFAITAGVMARSANGLASWRGKWLFLLPIAAAVYVGLTGFYGYVPDSPDCPELGAFRRHTSIRTTYGLAYGALSLAMVFRPLRALRTYLFAFAPLFALVLTGATHYISMYSSGVFPNIHDKAGVFARDYLGEEVRDLTVIDGVLERSKKALFHIDNPETDFQRHYIDPIYTGFLKPGKNWVLVMGQRDFPESHNKFSIVYKDPAQTENMTRLMHSQGVPWQILEYSLIRITDFDFSADLTGKNKWPVADVHLSGTTAAVEYRIPLSGNYDVSIEPDPAAASGQYELGAVDKDGAFVAATTLEKGHTALLHIPGEATGILLRRVDAQDLGVRRLVVIPEENNE